MKNQLVFMSEYIKAEPFTTSDIVSVYAGISHHAIQQLISKHENDLSEFGSLAFEMRPRPHKKGASLEKVFRLNEQQATLLITYLKNTESVRHFKKALVHSLFLMKQELTKRQISRGGIKKVHKDLAEAVKLIPPHNSSQYDYSKYNSLAYILAFGCSASKLKKQRNAKPDSNAIDYLTSDEIEFLYTIKDKICLCIEMGMGYKEIKERLKTALKESEKDAG